MTYIFDEQKKPKLHIKITICQKKDKEREKVKKESA